MANSINFNQSQAITNNLSTIAELHKCPDLAQLHKCPDLMVFVVGFLNSHEALASRGVCTKWNKLISTRCIAPILYRELQPQVIPFLEHIGKTFEQYFSARGILVSSLNSVQKAYDCLAPIKWSVSLGKCFGPGSLAEITPEKILESLESHLLHTPSLMDFAWRRNLEGLLVKLGFPTVTWEQLGRALLTPAERLERDLDPDLETRGSSVPEVIENQELLTLAERLEPDLEPRWETRGFNVPEVGEDRVSLTLAERLELDLDPDLEMLGFNVLEVVEKIHSFVHSKVKEIPYFQLCGLEAEKLPIFTEGCISLGATALETSECVISFCADSHVLYNLFPATLLGFKEEDYAEKNTLSLNPVMGQHTCFPINGRFFEFTIREAQRAELEFNIEEELGMGYSDCSSDDCVQVNVSCESFKREFEYNAWQCISSYLYHPEDEFKRTTSVGVTTQP